MSIYRICLNSTVSAWREVEADSFDEALDLVLDDPPYAPGFADYEFDDVWDHDPAHYRDGEYIDEADS